VFLNNRHYDPTTGVFISVDPLVTKTMQPCIYGGANPVTYSDPSGLCIVPGSFSVNSDGTVTYTQMGGTECYNSDEDGHGNSGDGSDGGYGVASVNHSVTGYIGTPGKADLVGGLKEIGIGVAKTPGSIIGGASHIVTNPIETGEGLWWAANNPGEAATALFDGCIETAQSFGTCLGEIATGAAIVKTSAVSRTSRFIVNGREISVGPNFRLAPFGNRTGNVFGRWPHYHRRVVDPATGQTVPGGGIGRHRPWQPKSTDNSFWDRF